MKRANQKTVPSTAIIYVRVSSKEQVDVFSLQTQEQVCRDFADKIGLQVFKVFVERGESAKNTERTEFQKALLFCSKHKGQIGYFIVYKVDRFARNKEDHYSTKIILRQFETRLISATDLDPIN